MYIRHIIHGELQKFHCVLGFLCKSAFGLVRLKEAVLCNKELLRGLGDAAASWLNFIIYCQIDQPDFLPPALWV